MKMTTNMYVCIFIFWHVSDITVEAINLTYMIISSYYFAGGRNELFSGEAQKISPFIYPRS